MGEERRTAARHRVFIPIRMDGTSDIQVGKVTSGVTRDVSEGGLLIRTRRKFTIGAPVTVVVHYDPETGVKQELPGTVLRVAKNAADPSGLWPYEVAIVLDDPAPGLQAHAMATGFIDEG